MTVAFGAGVGEVGLRGGGRSVRKNVASACEPLAVGAEAGEVPGLRDPLPPADILP